MATTRLAGDVYGTDMRVHLKPTKIGITDPNALWVDYDQDTDSMVIYLTGRPVRGVTVYLDDDIYVIADPGTGEIVGFQVDAWERSFLPRHTDLKLVWPEIKQTISPEEGWSEPLKVYLLFAVMLFRRMFGSPDNSSSDMLPSPV